MNRMLLLFVTGYLAVCSPAALAITRQSNDGSDVWFGCAFPLIESGAEGVTVDTIQYLLNYHGADPQLVVDGVWGADTTAAVEQFQTGAGLQPDGEVGSGTWSALVVSTAKGDDGQQVMAVQDELASRYGYNVSVDGEFGSATDNAVVQFQSSRRIAANGVVGTDTWMDLTSGCNATAVNLYGFDQSHYQGNVSVTDYECLSGEGYSFAVLLAQESDTTISPYVIDQLHDASLEGFVQLDVYAFLDFTENDPSCVQINKTLEYLASNNATFGRIWFDIEGTKSTSQTFNQNFVLECEANVRAWGAPLGIYCSRNSWIGIFGDSFAPFSSYPLWYAHYDGIPSFLDWLTAGPYGGWSMPTIKQFQGTTDACGTQLDQNWSPTYPNV